MTGLEAVVPPGEVITVGGPIRKDVAGYDLKSLLVGSEGTLGLVTAAWLRLIPAPELELPVVGLYRDAEAGVSAIERVLASGVVPAAIEYLDGVTLSVRRRRVPVRPPGRRRVHGHHRGRRLAPPRRGASRASCAEALAEDAVAVHAPTEPARSRRCGAGARAPRSRSSRSAAARYSEDIAVPLDRLARRRCARRSRSASATTCPRSRSATRATATSTRRSSSRPTTPTRSSAPTRRATTSFRLALRLGGTVSGEHGIGWLKRGQLEHQLGPAGYDLHRRIKHAFDPKNLLNPGKKR